MLTMSGCIGLATLRCGADTIDSKGAGQLKRKCDARLCKQATGNTKRHQASERSAGEHGRGRVSGAGIQGKLHKSKTLNTLMQRLKDSRTVKHLTNGLADRSSRQTLANAHAECAHTTTPSTQTETSACTHAETDCDTIYQTDKDQSS